MKRLALIAVFLLGTTSNAVERDKLLHLSVSYGISYTGMQLLPDGYKWLSPVIALAIGAAKELSDQQFDRKDMLFNAIGVGASVIVYEFQ